MRKIENIIIDSPKATPYVIELVPIFFANSLGLKPIKRIKEKYIRITMKENKCEIFLFTLMYLSFFLFIIELILKKTKLMIISLVYLNFKLKIYSYGFNFGIIF